MSELHWQQVELFYLILFNFGNVPECDELWIRCTISPVSFVIGYLLHFKKTYISIIYQLLYIFVPRILTSVLCFIKANSAKASSAFNHKDTRYTEKLH